MVCALNDRRDRARYDDFANYPLSTRMESVPNFFGGNDAGAGANGGGGFGLAGETVLAAVNCGRLNRDGTTMKADQRKGQLRVIQASMDDMLKQVQWGVRDPSTPFEPEDDFIIIPDEAVLKPMKQPGCFVLTFLEERDRDMFFWFQEPKDANRDELLNKFNRQINNDLNAMFGGAEPSQATANDDDAQMADAPVATSTGMTSETPAPVTTSMPPPASVLVPSPVEPTPAPSAMVAATPAAPVKISDDMRTPAHEANFTPIVSNEMLKGVFANLGGGTPKSNIGLPEILTPELVGPLLRDDAIRGRLLEYLPEEHRDTQDLEDLIRTPQFRSQLESFSHALQSGEMDLAQFGLKQAGVADLESFLNAIQAEVGATDDQQQEGNDAMES